MKWLNWPNRITVGRIILVPPLVICLLNLNAGWSHWRHAALVLVAVMAISDGLDGYLARVRREETALGRFLDPVADKLLIASAVILLAVDSTAVPGFVLPNWVPVIALGKDIIVLIGFGLIYATTDQYFVQPRILGKTCTLIQLIMIIYCLLGPDLAPLLQQGWVIVYWLASGLAIVAAADYVRIGNRFATNCIRKSTTKPNERA